MTEDFAGFLVGRGRTQPFIVSRPKCHLLACGPTQSGKTTSILANAVLRLNGAQQSPAALLGPRVCSSTKDDLLMLPHRGPGSTLVLDLMGAVSVPHNARAVHFSPLSLVTSFELALLVGRILMDTAYSMSRSGVDNDAYWTQRAARLLAALLWAAVRAGLSITDVFTWIAAQDADTPTEYLRESDVQACSILRGYAGTRRGGNTVVAVWSFAEQAVGLYAYPAAAQRATLADFDVEAFVRSQDTLHIVCPSRWSTELGPIIAVLVQALADARYRLHEHDRHAPALSLILDEVANTAPLPSLSALCSEGAGQGVRLLLGAQDRAQLEERWGEGPARTIINNCRDRVVLAELGDRAFLDDIETLSGVRHESESTATVQKSGRGPSTSQSTSYREQPLWRTWEIAQLRPYHALYLCGWTGRLVKLIPWEEVLQHATSP
ncbi:hypothetical protein GCM10027586_04370 [Kineococcus gypseus]|uniref:type IV secretory system conjugative DNA transfer family protein n=1 Tax=Kineococcus gypseus TaxID=1637102 RepID=UPI003D7EAF79